MLGHRLCLSVGAMASLDWTTQNYPFESELVCKSLLVFARVCRENTGQAVESGPQQSVDIAS